MVIDLAAWRAVWAAQSAVCIDCGAAPPSAHCEAGGHVRAMDSIPDELAEHLAALAWRRGVRQRLLKLIDRVSVEGATAALRGEVAEVLAALPPRLAPSLGPLADVLAAQAGVAVVLLPEIPEA